MTQTNQIAPLARTDVPVNFNDIIQASKFLANSKIMPDHLRGDEAAVANVMVAARSLDIPMFAAFQGIIVQSGRTSMSANLMQSLVIRAGFNLYLTVLNDEGATVRAFRSGIGEGEIGYADVSFTLQDALNAKLLTKVDHGYIARSANGKALPWEYYRQDMMLARAISRASRRYFPDVLLGMLYTPDEIGRVVDEDGTILDGEVITVEPTAEVKRFALQIANADGHERLKEVWYKVRDAGLLGEVIDDLTLGRRIEIRMKDLGIPPKPKQEPAAAEAEGKPDEPAADSGTDTAETESEPAETESAPEADESNIDGKISTQDDAQPVDEYDAMAAAAAAEPVVVEDPAESREDTPRRQAVENTLSTILNGWPDVAAAGAEHFGITVDKVSTERLQAWALELKRDAK